MTDVEQTRHAAEKCWGKLVSQLTPKVYRALLCKMLDEEIRRVQKRAELKDPKREKDLKDLASKLGTVRAAMSGDSDY